MCGTGVALSKSMREAASNSDIWLMLNVMVDLGLDKIKLQFVKSNIVLNCGSLYPREYKHT